ncbi:TNF receptor-associated factor 6-like [Acropora palmata]|uniref:TNF receptor-associated factor 6-like n=1 Tax=Acropora palmata TaxID=6131 RepID=UPI003D9FC8EC
MAMSQPLGAEDISSSLRETTNPLSLSSEDYDEWFVPPLSKNLECGICLCALRDPVETPCRHIYCEDCILRSIRNVGPECPLCMNHLNESQLNPDNFARREICNHRVFCRLKKVHECSWKGPLSKVEDHLKECDFVDVLCPKTCGKKFQRIDLKKHLGYDCPNRTSRCSYCAEEVLWNSMENHLHVCPQYPLTCDDCGLLNIPRYEMQDHKNQECVLNFAGSSSQGLRLAQSGNSSSQASKHRRPDALWVNQKLYSNLVSLTQQSNVRVETLLQELISRFNLEEMRVPWFEASVCNGSFSWRIENYRQRRQDAINGIEKAIYSPAFYIFVDGYKLCLSIYLNGVNSEVGEFIDILVHVMLGVNDSKLVWPLTGMLTLGILDQSEGPESPQHIKHSFNADPNQLAFQRPTGPRNVGYHCIRIPVSRILEHLYIKNDSILVGIEIAR